MPEEEIQYRHTASCTVLLAVVIEFQRSFFTTAVVHFQMFTHLLHIPLMQKSPNCWTNTFRHWSWWGSHPPHASPFFDDLRLVCLISELSNEPLERETRMCQIWCQQCNEYAWFLAMVCVSPRSQNPRSTPDIQWCRSATWKLNWAHRVDNCLSVPFSMLHEQYNSSSRSQAWSSKQKSAWIIMAQETMTCHWKGRQPP